MAQQYTINLPKGTNGTSLNIEVPYGQTVETFSLELVGRAAPNYGEIFAKNTLLLLNNHASDESDRPSTPLIGQLWYNHTKKQLLYYVGTGVAGADANGWATVSSSSTVTAVTTGGTGTSVPPTQGGVIYGASTTAYGSSLAGSTTGAVGTGPGAPANGPQVLVSGGTGSPVWRNQSQLHVASATAANTATSATTADQLATARTITLSGDATGSVSFNGSGNVTLPVAVVNDSHNHTVSTITGLQTTLDGKVDEASTNVTDLNLDFTLGGGFYRAGSTATNTPIAASTSIFYHQYSSSAGAQIVVPASATGANQRLFFRGGAGGVWGGWSEVPTLSASNSFTGANTFQSTVAVNGRLTIQTGESSSVAVSSNASDLVIEGSGPSGITITTPSNSFGSIYFGDAQSSSIGRITYNHTDDTMVMYAGSASPAFTVYNNGVLIGATHQFLGRTTDAATEPSFSWSGDSDTGIYNAATNSVGIAAGGSPIATFNSAGMTLSSKKITGLATPTAASDAATKAYVDGRPVAKAFAKFTMTSGTVTVLNSYGVSSISTSTISGGGDAKINFSTAQPNSQYVIVASGGTNADSGDSTENFYSFVFPATDSGLAPTTTSFGVRVSVDDDDGTNDLHLSDSAAAVHVAVFGD